MLDTRDVRRRRACEVCGHRFTTVEVLIDAVKQRAEPPAQPVPTKEDKAQAKVAARRRLEEMRDRRASSYNPFDDDNNFIPDKW